jgi:hypothetical protein
MNIIPDSLQIILTKMMLYPGLCIKYNLFLKYNQYLPGKYFAFNYKGRVNSYTIRGIGIL